MSPGTRSTARRQIHLECYFFLILTVSTNSFHWITPCVPPSRACSNAHRTYRQRHGTHSQTTDACAARARVSFLFPKVRSLSRTSRQWLPSAQSHCFLGSSCAWLAQPSAVALWPTPPETSGPIEICVEMRRPKAAQLSTTDEPCSKSALAVVTNFPSTAGVVSICNCHFGGAHNFDRGVEISPSSVTK